jgi:IS30 family transposase
MRQAREIIRLKFSSFSAHEIARRLGMARSTVREMLQRAESAALSWPQAEGMSDTALEGALYANRRSRRGHRRVAEPDWVTVHREMKRKHVTLTILWDEYIAANPGGRTPRRPMNQRLRSRKRRRFRTPHAASVARRIRMRAVRRRNPSCSRWCLSGVRRGGLRRGMRWRRWFMKRFRMP